MKARGILVAMVLIGYSVAFSQEYDDVYFSRKDRQKAVALEPKTLKTLDQTEETENYQSLPKFNRRGQIDGYTGRTINPDYQNAQSTGTDVSSYFISNYQPVGANGQLHQYPTYASNGYNSYGGGWGMGSRYGFGSGMYSPFYSSYGYNGYSPYSYGMYDPYGYNSYNSWGYSPYSSWGNSYYGYNSGWGIGYRYGFGSGLFGGWYSNNNYYGQGATNPDNHVNRTYGKRSSRNDGIVNSGSTSRGSQVTNGQSTGTRGGRVATTNSASGNRYYQRGWRQDPTINPSAANGSTRSSVWGGGNSSGRTSTWGNTNSGTIRNNSWNNDSFGTGGSRSTGTFGTGGGTRSGGSSFGSGGSSGGRSSGGGGHSTGSRGRN